MQNVLNLVFPKSYLSLLKQKILVLNTKNFPNAYNHFCGSNDIGVFATFSTCALCLCRLKLVPVIEHKPIKLRNYNIWAT